jgi:hypothetical protein
MKRTRLYHLIEGYLDGTLSPAEREELAAAVAAEPSIKARFVDQVQLARRLRAGLRPRAGAGTWDKISGLTTPQESARRQRIADRVDAALDPKRRGRGRATWRWVGGGLAAAAAAAFLLARPSGDGGRPPATALAPTPEQQQAQEPPGPTPLPIERLGPAPSPPVALGENRPPPGPAPPPAAPAGRPLLLPTDPQDARAALVAEMAASGEPALAARSDLLQYLGFDVSRPLRAIQGRLRPRFTEVASGLTGSGLRVHFQREAVGLPGGGARVFIAASALTQGPEPSPPHDELHLRYYVRLSDTFDFAGGGVLPGLCMGSCAEGPRAVRPRADIVRLRWTPLGELMFDPLPGTRPRDGRWQRVLGRGTWHCIELRVKLNTPGAADGVVEGWLDGARAVSLTGVQLRDAGTSHLQGVWFHTMFRGGPAPAPRRDGHITFDNVAVASGYLGPRAP